jgi:hypothetical protein
MERRAKRDLQLEEERARREESYKRKLQEIDDEIDHQRRADQYNAEAEKQKQTLEDRKSALENLKQRAVTAAKAADIAKTISTMKASAQVKQPSSYSWNGNSVARTEWEFLKQSEGEHSKPLDDLMQMIGLEEVKQKFLDVKSKVDTALRQGVSMASERFSCSMLGNPGTGMSPFSPCLLCCSGILLTNLGGFRQNYGGSPIRSASHRSLCHSRLELQGNHRGCAGKYRCVWVQEAH